MADEEKVVNAHLKEVTFHDRLETLILRGETSPIRLAAAFNCTPEEMVLHIRKVFKAWRERRVEEFEETRQYRIEQMNMLMRYALQEYDKSKQPITEYTETVVPCGVCN